MSSAGLAAVSGGRTATRAFEFGKTHVVMPKDRHLATVVWMHGLGDNGASWSQMLETIPLRNIKWICPTAPTRPVTCFGGFPSTAWFDVESFSEYANEDVEGLDASAAHVVNLLSTEPANIKLGVGGFSMGAATSLYSATCLASGKHGNGNSYSANISAFVGLSGWLPCSKDLNARLQGVKEAATRAASLPLLLCHGTDDDVIPHQLGDKSAAVLRNAGFQDVTFKSYDGVGHFTSPEEIDYIRTWLASRLGLEAGSS